MKYALMIALYCISISCEAQNKNDTEYAEFPVGKWIVHPEDDPIFGKDTTFYFMEFNTIGDFTEEIPDPSGMIVHKGKWKLNQDTLTLTYQYSGYNEYSQKMEMHEETVDRIIKSNDYFK
jgi:hypothetical protein